MRYFLEIQSLCGFLYILRLCYPFYLNQTLELSLPISPPRMAATAATSASLFISSKQIAPASSRIAGTSPSTTHGMQSFAFGSYGIDAILIPFASQ